MQHMHFQRRVKQTLEPWFPVFSPPDRNEETKKSRSRQLSWSSGSSWQWKIIVIATTYRQATLFPERVSRYLELDLVPVLALFHPYGAKPGSRANWTVAGRSCCWSLVSKPGKDSSKSIDQLQARPLGIGSSSSSGQNQCPVEPCHLLLLQQGTTQGQLKGNAAASASSPLGGLMLAVKHV